mmetsp:Transcript_65560/g.77054  ORF Transcript_65560/g.77054 Transcript_65560/m.77054 type:complete len:508 (-) Transcript_65560:56-1579(-)
MLRFLSFDPLKLNSSDFDDEETKKQYKRTFLKYGQPVHWLSGRHYDAEYLEMYRLVGDIEMDRLLEMSAVEANDVGGKFSNTIKACADIYHQRKHQRNEITNNKISEKHLAMYEFYKHYFEHVPAWVDWEQLQRGIDVYISFLPAIGYSLYYLALIPGFSIPKIGKVLEQTRYLVPPSTEEQVMHRLFDTGGFVNHALLDVSNLKPGEVGWTMALQVRALHAKVRRSILQKKKDKWNVAEYGIPINQEDMAATLLAFSVNPIIGIEFLSGKSLSLDMQTDYMALWRYIGWLLGVETKEDNESLNCLSNKTHSNLISLDPCGKRLNGRSYENSIIHGRATLESMVCHLMHPNKQSAIVAKHLLSIGRKSTTYSHENRTYLYNFMGELAVQCRFAMCRKSIGGELADALELPRGHESLLICLANIFATGILLALRTYTLLTMKSKIFRKIVFAKHLKGLEQFNKLWSMKNGKRMHKAALNAMPGKEPRSELSKTCPFSFVMPPHDERID